VTRLEQYEVIRRMCLVERRGTRAIARAVGSASAGGSSGRGAGAAACAQGLAIRHGAGIQPSQVCEAGRRPQKTEVTEMWLGFLDLGLLRTLDSTLHMC